MGETVTAQRIATPCPISSGDVHFSPMRRLLAGLLILLLSSSALADMKAEVESIGFNNIYRPDCWTPMVVRITPDKSGTFQLQVFQEDLDGDEPIFTQEITLTGSEEGSTAAEQRFWMYFIPQPTHGGLLDVNRARADNHA